MGKQREAKYMAPLIANMTGVVVTDGLNYINSYDMIIIGGERGSTADFQPPFVNSVEKKPVMIVYPPKKSANEGVDLP